MIRVNLLNGCYVEERIEPELPRCVDCGDPATELSDPVPISSIWAALALTKVKVCPPCFRRRHGK